jgi:hypothetical protein
VTSIKFNSGARHKKLALKRDTWFLSQRPCGFVCVFSGGDHLDLRRVDVWSRPFNEPIALPDRRKPVTLRDAGEEARNCAFWITSPIKCCEKVQI